MSRSEEQGGMAIGDSMRITPLHIGGSVNEAAALGFILILLGASCLFAINRITGTKMGGVFG